MKVKTLRSILQTGVVLAVVLLLSLAIILIVQYVEIANLQDKKDDLEEQQSQSVVQELSRDWVGDVWSENEIELCSN